MVVHYLNAAELCGLHELITEAAGTEAALLDEGKLEAASLRPQNAAYYDAAGLFEQAAVLVTGIALAHTFSDGNKRLAVLAGSTFLDLNGFVVRAPTHAFAGGDPGDREPRVARGNRFRHQATRFLAGEACSTGRKPDGERAILACCGVAGATSQAQPASASTLFACAFGGSHNTWKRALMV